MNHLPYFNQPIVRDLAWSCFGPSLLQLDSQVGVHVLDLTLTDARLKWLHQLDQDPTPLHAHVETLKSRRLGLYFEALWHFFLCHDDELELIAHNVPIYEDKITLGELDVLYRHKQSGQVTHLELAVKYYLHTHAQASSAQPADFLGPNCRDRLHLKLERLLQHQCPLSSTPAGQATLASLGIDRPIQQAVLVKGWLFYAQARQPSPTAPIAPSHGSGAWFLLSAFEDEARQSSHWVVLDKPLWLSPAVESHARDCLNGAQLMEWLTDFFNQDTRPRMVCSLKKQGPTYQETARYFVTPNDWPQSSPNRSVC